MPSPERVHPSREAAPWYQHEEIGYNYRISNIVASVIRGQIPYLDEHIAMAPMVRGEQDYLYQSVSGKSSPQEILEAIAAFKAEGRPVWKPMHMQPIYRTHAFITVEGNGRGKTNAYIKGQGIDVGADLFRRGLCLPSDNKMTRAQQDRIIEIIHRCFE